MHNHIVLTASVFLSMASYTAADCLHRKYSSVDGHTACLSSSEYVTAKGMTQEEEDSVLRLHNQYRAAEPAADMQKMVWDDEIAAIAEKWADNCEYNHDRKRSIPGRFSVGQNLAVGYRNWSQVVTAWYDEVKDFTYGSENNIFHKIGHYTQMTWSISTKLGCAYSECSNLRHYSGGRFYVCNYGPGGNIGNINDISKPYKLKTRSKCEDCPGRCDEKLQICDCGGKTCENGGTLDLETCTCSCKQPFHTTDDCKLNCTAAVDAFYCGTQFPPSYCTRYNNVPDECPIMCGVCPYGGIKYRNLTTTVTTTKPPQPTTTTKPPTRPTLTERLITTTLLPPTTGVPDCNGKTTPMSKATLLKEMWKMFGDRNGKLNITALFDGLNIMKDGKLSGKFELDDLEIKPVDDQSGAIANKVSALNLVATITAYFYI